MEKPMLSKLGILCILSFFLSACSGFGTSDGQLSYPMAPQMKYNVSSSETTAGKSYASRLPSTLHTGEKTILIDPNVHAWGAYNAQGELVRSGLITAGSSYCPDIKRPCKTRAGSFRIQSLGNVGCKSTIYPLPKGGAPMPYCMFFNGNQGLHGSYGNAVVEANVSHGCVRMRVSDAEWVRHNFANVGTKVVVKSY